MCVGGEILRTGTIMCILYLSRQDLLPARKRRPGIRFTHLHVCRHPPPLPNSHPAGRRSSVGVMVVITARPWFASHGSMEGNSKVEGEGV